jgi:hypothetical protein
MGLPRVAALMAMADQIRLGEIAKQTEAKE